MTDTATPMQINDITYDIDNVDIEEEMVSRDIEDEEIECEELMDRHDEENIRLMSSRLTARNLDLDLANADESTRRRYSFRHKGTDYTGFAIYRMGINVYLFSVDSPDTSTGRKTVKLNINELKQIH